MTTHILAAGGFSSLHSIITIYKKSDVVTGEDRSFTAFITDIDAGSFEKAIEFKKVFGNGYVPILNGANPTEVSISFTAHPTDVQGANSIADFLLERDTAVSVDGLLLLNSEDTHDPCKVKLEWRTADAIAANVEAFKKIYYNAYATNITHTLTPDGHVEGQITFTISPFGDSGVSNYYEFLLTSNYSGNPSSDWTTFEETLDTTMGYDSV